MSGKKIWPTVEVENTPLQRGSSRAYHIFLVANDADLRRLNVEVLLESGYQVSVAEDGMVAWDALQINKYDLLVAEHNPPRLSGMDLLKKLHLARIALPTVLVAGAPPTEELKRCPWLQIEAWLLKPYTPDDLLAIVKNVLYAIDKTGTTLAPAPNWQSQPVADCLRP